MLVEFSKLITDLSDEKQTVLTNDEIFKAFRHSYMNLVAPIDLVRYHCDIVNKTTHLDAVITYNNAEQRISGEGNGPLDAFSNALRKAFSFEFELDAYSQHTLQNKSDSLAVSYIGIKTEKGTFWGAGTDGNINTASVHALISAVNRYLK